MSRSPENVCGLCGAPGAERICDVYRCIQCMTMGAQYIIVDTTEEHPQEIDEEIALQWEEDARAERESEVFLDTDFSNLAEVIALANELGGGSTVVKYPTRDNYNIVLDYVRAEREGAEVAWHPGQN